MWCRSPQHGGVVTKVEGRCLFHFRCCCRWVCQHEQARWRPEISSRKGRRERGPTLNGQSVRNCVRDRWGTSAYDLNRSMPLDSNIIRCCLNVAKILGRPAPCRIGSDSRWGCDRESDSFFLQFGSILSFMGSSES